MAGKQNSGNGYWATQIGASALFGFGGVIGGPVGMALDKEEPGRWLIVTLMGIAFVIVFFGLVRKYRSSSKKQRAVYAWALEQQNGALQTDGFNPGNDVAAMAVAQRAMEGKLTPAELERLQAMRPNSIYPGDPPVADVSLPPRADTTP
jgi:hypothetical protein